jgi:hypothetical protein
MAAAESRPPIQKVRISAFLARDPERDPGIANLKRAARSVTPEYRLMVEGLRPAGMKRQKSTAENIRLSLHYTRKGHSEMNTRNVWPYPVSKSRKLAGIAREHLPEVIGPPSWKSIVPLNRR